MIKDGRIMKKTKLMAAAFLFGCLTTSMAQDKLFTLEDLNYGGTNFYNLQPDNRYYEWWGLCVPMWKNVA